MLDVMLMTIALNAIVTVRRRDVRMASLEMIFALVRRHALARVKRCVCSPGSILAVVWRKRALASVRKAVTVHPSRKWSISLHKYFSLSIPTPMGNATHPWRETGGMKELRSSSGRSLTAVAVGTALGCYVTVQPSPSVQAEPAWRRCARGKDGSDAGSGAGVLDGGGGAV